MASRAGKNSMPRFAIGINSGNNVCRVSKQPAYLLVNHNVHSKPKRFSCLATMACTVMSETQSAALNFLHWNQGRTLAFSVEVHIGHIDVAANRRVDIPTSIIRHPSTTHALLLLW